MREKNNIPSEAERGSPRRVSARIDARSTSNIKRSSERTERQDETQLILMGNQQIYPKRQHRPDELVGFARQNPEDEDGRFVTLPKPKNRVRPTNEPRTFSPSVRFSALGEKCAARGGKCRSVRVHLRTNDDALPHADSSFRSFGDDHRNIYSLDRRIDVDRVS